MIGTLLVAPEHFSWWKALLAIAGSVFFLAGTNFVNDSFGAVLARGLGTNSLVASL